MRSGAAVVSKIMHVRGKRLSISTGTKRRQDAHNDRPRHSLKLGKTSRAAPAEEASIILSY